MARPVLYRTAFAEGGKVRWLSQNQLTKLTIQTRRFKMATEKVRVKTGFGALNDPAAVSLSGNVAAGLPVTFDLKTLIRRSIPRTLRRRTMILSLLLRPQIKAGHCKPPTRRRNARS